MAESNVERLQYVKNELNFYESTFNKEGYMHNSNAAGLIEFSKWLIERAEIGIQNEGIVQAIVGEEVLNQEGAYETEMMKLQEENARLREALEFYAKEKNWTEQTHYFTVDDNTGPIRHEAPPLVWDDVGEKARQALRRE